MCQKCYCCLNTKNGYLKASTKQLPSLHNKVLQFQHELYYFYIIK